MKLPRALMFADLLRSIGQTGAFRVCDRASEQSFWRQARYLEADLPIDHDIPRRTPLSAAAPSLHMHANIWMAHLHDRLAQCP